MHLSFTSRAGSRSLSISLHNLYLQDHLFDNLSIPAGRFSSRQFLQYEKLPKHLIHHHEVVSSCNTFRRASCVGRSPSGRCARQNGDEGFRGGHGHEHVLWKGIQWWDHGHRRRSCASLGLHGRRINDHDSEYQGCCNQFTGCCLHPHCKSITAPFWVNAKIVQVIVGGSAGLVYTPETLSAAVGDMVVFTFMAQNHTASQSAFGTPCDKLAGGMDSGFMPNPSGTVNPPPQMAIQVKVSTPLCE